MIFLGNLTKETEERYRVGYVHYMPFDLKNGIKNANGRLATREELLEIGVLVEEMPKPEPPEGKVVAGRFYNPFSGTVFYEYIDEPEREETPEERIENLEAQVDTLALSILDVMGV